MAEIYKFFNSTGSDPRVYQASDFALFFDSVLSSGLIHTDAVPGLSATVAGGTLNTVVSKGRAVMRGHLYENTTPLTLTHSIPDATRDRIDRVVLRLDLSNENRNIKLRVIEGTPSANPVPPNLQRDNQVHEISLAHVRVRANTVQLLPTDLVDERLDEQLCGLASSLITIPTSQLQTIIANKKQVLDVEMSAAQQQLTNDLTSWKQQWTSWFNTVQSDTFDTKEDARKRAEQTSYKVTKSSKDSEGVFRNVEYRRLDNTLAAKSVLSGGNAPNYTTRTVTFYALNGTTTEKTTVFTLSYDSDGDLVSEV